MRHRVKGRQLSRTSSHREATLNSLAQALFMEDRIVTTVAKAKELRPFAEKLITRARRGDLHSRREVLRHLKRPEVVDRLFHDVAPSFQERPGGYTRIVKLGYRKSDAAELALIELVGRGMQEEGGKAKTAARLAAKEARAKKAAAAKERAEQRAAGEPVEEGEVAGVEVGGKAPPKAPKKEEKKAPEKGAEEKPAGKDREKEKKDKKDKKEKKERAPRKPLRGLLGLRRRKGGKQGEGE
jgi:large subunit ribosomal protein L17